MRIVFGIGNPGPDYAGTRHNLGFRVVETLAARAGVALAPIEGLRADGARIALAGEPALLVRPLTYVNRCGPILALLCEREGVDPSGLLVVVDDLDLEPGRLRLRARGGDGGHNGLRSLIEHLGTESFARLRIGIGSAGDRPAEAYVLEPIPERERPRLDQAVERAADAAGTWAGTGIEVAMSRVNVRDLDPSGDGP